MFNLINIELGGIDTRDYPDFVDAYIQYAEYPSGNPVPYYILDYINDSHQDFVYELVLAELF